MSLNKKTKVSLLLGSLVAALSLSVCSVAAAVPTVGVSRYVGFSSIEEAFGTALRWGIFFAILVAGLYMIWAGFQYVTAGDDADEAENARKRMTNAVVGVIIVASVYLILRVLTFVIPDLDQILTL